MLTHCPLHPLPDLWACDYLSYLATQGRLSAVACAPDIIEDMRICCTEQSCAPSPQKVSEQREGIVVFTLIMHLQRIWSLVKRNFLTFILVLQYR
jgi:hypothetical protein